LLSNHEKPSTIANTLEKRSKNLMRCLPDAATKSLHVLLLGGWAVFTLSGCRTPQDQLEPLPEGSPSPARVTLAAGDVVDVRFFYTPELNVTQAIRPDGRISLQLIGEVMAQGKSPEELRAELLTLYQPHLKEPDVAVIVQSFYHRRVFVGGQVQRPGAIPLPGQLTALSAIVEAGGFLLPYAEVGSVVILRRRGEVNYGYCINLKPALKGGEVRPFYLEPEDVVYVPQTQITQVGQWIEQHINNIIPKTGFVWLYTTGKSTFGYDLR
jgi:polysaccharide export outer membrane protein